MASYQTCRECGSDMTSAEEEEQGLCLECQAEAQEANVNTDYCDEPFLDDGSPNPRYNPHPLYSRTK